MNSLWSHWLTFTDHCPIKWRIDEYLMNSTIRNGNFFRMFFVIVSHISSNRMRFNRKMTAKPIPFSILWIRLSANNLFSAAYSYACMFIALQSKHIKTMTTMIVMMASTTTAAARLAATVLTKKKKWFILHTVRLPYMICYGYWWVSQTRASLLVSLFRFIVFTFGSIFYLFWFFLCAVFLFIFHMRSLHQHTTTQTSIHTPSFFFLFVFLSHSLR